MLFRLGLRCSARLSRIYSRTLAADLYNHLKPNLRWDIIGGLRMKHISLRYGILLCTLTVALVLVGCTKEGVYNPKNKIAMITETWSNATYSEHWIWDGKHLTEIRHSYNSEYFGGEWVDYFSYDSKHRISEIRSDEGILCTYIYDGNELSELKISSDGVLLEHMEFSHEKGKISEIQVKVYDFYKSSPTRTRSLRYILPASTIEHMDQLQCKNHMAADTKATYAYNVYFTWEGNNIVKEVLEDFYNGECSIDTYTYEYDKKKNPFSSLLVTEAFTDYTSSSMPLSENNILKVNGKTQYEYLYEGKYPVQAKFYAEDGRYMCTINYTYQ